MSEIITADVIDGLNRLPSQYADMCVTSPPYFGLRNYGVDGQIGLEQTPEAYAEKLVKVFRSVRRILKDDGTLWLNIGDSYAGSNGNGTRQSKWKTADTYAANYAYSLRKMTGRKDIGYKPKDLIGIPWMVAFALRADGWYLRQDIIWSKPNAMPESVKDRCTKSHEYIFLFSKSPHYFFDGEAIKEPRAGSRGAYGTPQSRLRNKRDVWNVATKGYSGAHFAAFPPELIRPCILAGSRKGGIVVDPFFGSGTTGVVATEEGREYIGIDINKEYTELAWQRIAGVERSTP